MTKYKKVIIFFEALLLLLPFRLFAHGVKGEIDTGAIVITAQYDTGEAMNYAKVKVLAPGAQFIFQSGRTDKNGRFSFSPDTPGDWEVVVDDEMGHWLEITVPVDENLALPIKQQPETAVLGSHSKYQRAFMGICIIFGILGMVFWWKGKRDGGKIFREK